MDSYLVPVVATAQRARRSSGMDSSYPTLAFSGKIAINRGGLSYAVRSNRTSGWSRSLVRVTVVVAKVARTLARPSALVMRSKFGDTIWKWYVPGGSVTLLGSRTAPLNVNVASSGDSGVAVTGPCIVT
jgi:hypothetical protein